MPVRCRLSPLFTVKLSEFYLAINDAEKTYQYLVRSVSADHRRDSFFFFLPLPTVRLLFASFRRWGNCSGRWPIIFEIEIDSCGCFDRQSCVQSNVDRLRELKKKKKKKKKETETKLRVKYLWTNYFEQRCNFTRRCLKRNERVTLNREFTNFRFGTF